MASSSSSSSYGRRRPAVVSESVVGVGFPPRSPLRLGAVASVASDSESATARGSRAAGRCRLRLSSLPDRLAWLVVLVTCAAACSWSLGAVLVSADCAPGQADSGIVCSTAESARQSNLDPNKRCNCFYDYCDQGAAYTAAGYQRAWDADTAAECAHKCYTGDMYYAAWFGWRGEGEVGALNSCQVSAGLAKEVPVPPTVATFTAALPPAGSFAAGATIQLTVTPTSLDGDGITLVPTCTGITGSVDPPLLFFKSDMTAAQTFSLVAGSTPADISCTFANQYVDAAGVFQVLTSGFIAPPARTVPQPTTQATFTTTISSAATLVSGSTVTVTVTATSINGDGILLQPTCTGMAAGASVQPAQSFFLGEATTAQTFTFAAGATPSAISCTFTNQYVDASGSVQVLASGFFIAPPVHTLPQATTQATFSTALLPAAAKDIVSGSTVTLTVTPSSIDGDGVILQPTCTGMADGSNVQPAMSFFLGGASTAQTFTFVAGNIPSLLACTFTGETVDAAGVWQAMSTGLTAPDAVPARTSCGSGAPSTQCSSSLYARSTRLQPTIRCNCFYSYCDQEASYPSYPDQALNSADITTSGECATQCMALTTGGGHGYYASWFGWRGEVEVGTKGACQADSDREVPVPTTQATFTTVLPHLDTIEANQPVTLTLTPTSIDGDGVTVTPTCFGLSSGGITPTSIFFRGGGLATAQNFTLAVGATPADLQCTFEGKVVSAAGVFQPMITGFNAPTAVPVVPVITLKVTPITVTSVVPSIAPRPLTWRVGLTGANVLTQGDTTTVTVQCASGQVACAKADASSSSASSSIDCASAAASRTCWYTFDASSSALAPGDIGSAFVVTYLPRGTRGTADTCTYSVAHTGSSMGNAAVPAATKINLGSASALFLSLGGGVVDGAIVDTSAVPFTFTAEWPPAHPLTIDVACTGGADVGSFVGGRGSASWVIDAGSVTSSVVNFVASAGAIASARSILCEYTLRGEDAYRYLTPESTRLIVGADPAAVLGTFTFSGKGVPTQLQSLEAGALTQYIIAEPTLPITGDGQVRLSLVCRHSSQTRASSTFTVTDDGDLVRLMVYRTPLQCGVTDVCEWRLTGDESQVSRFMAPVWDNSLFGPTMPTVHAHEEAQNEAERVRQVAAAGM